MKDLTQDHSPLLVDDPARKSTLVESENGRHLGVVGGTYTILMDGGQTDGHYCLIGMHVPKGGGPPPHRHDFEESFTVLEGEIVATFRGHETTVRAGETLNVPANAPHAFTNRPGRARAPTLHLCPSGAGAVLPGNRGSGGNANDPSAEGHRGRAERYAGEERGARPEVPHGANLLNSEKQPLSEERGL